MDFSIEWILEILEMGNPVQIISKNIISEENIKQMKDVADYCVVGEFYLPNIQVLNFLEGLVGIDVSLNNYRNSTLDCSGSNEYKSIFSEQIEEFVKCLMDNGIKVFKKSSCVNSNILKIKNPGEYYKKEGYCVSCGNCV